MNIAIVGAGFSGLAVAWFLCQKAGIQLTVFDAIGIGGGASGIAAGLVHPYAGLHCKLNWKGSEGLQATLKLLNSCHEAVYAPTGLLRLALNDTAEKDYALCAQHNRDDVVWYERQTILPQAVPKPAVLIKSALTVYDIYLPTLWSQCQAKGVKYIQAEITTLEELHEFDQIVIACGSGTAHIREFADIPISLVKGQILELSWPAHLPPLPMPLNSQAYIMMAPGLQTCFVGATYERNFTSDKPNLEVAAADLLPKAIEMIPDLKESKIIGCRAALRASAPLHRPYMKKKEGASRYWILTGMGSKGLLYHALFGAQLADELFSA